MAALVQEAAPCQQERGAADRRHRNRAVHEVVDGLDELLVPGRVVVPSWNDQGRERAVVDQCIQRVEVGLRRQRQVPERAHRRQAVAHEQQPKAPGLELLRAGDLSGEVGVLPVRHGLGRVQGDGPHLGSSSVAPPSIDSMLSLSTACCQYRVGAEKNTERVGALA